MIYEGSVYRLEGTETTPHYHIIIFRDPSGKDKLSIATYTTSSTTMPDKTCEFMPGDDFFITKYSWIKYRNCKLLSDIDLSKFTSLGQVSSATLAKIKAGFEDALGEGKIGDDVKHTYLRWKENLLFNSLH